MRRVRREKRAAERAAAPPLVRHDEDVDGERSRDQRDVGGRDRVRPRARDEGRDPFAQQLEARDRQEADDADRAERLELVVPVWVVLVRLAAGHADEHDADQIVQHVEAGLERRAQHRERAGSRADHDLDERDRRVEQEHDDEHAAHRRRRRHAGAAAVRDGGLTR